MLCYTVTCPPNHPGGIANIKLKEQWSGTNEQEMMSSITNEKQPTSKPGKVICTVISSHALLASGSLC